MVLELSPPMQMVHGTIHNGSHNRLFSVVFTGIMSVGSMRLIGCRGAIILGGFVAALGPALAVFAESLVAICLTLGALTGKHAFGYPL